MECKAAWVPGIEHYLHHPSLEESLHQSHLQEIWWKSGGRSNGHLAARRIRKVENIKDFLLFEIGSRTSRPVYAQIPPRIWSRWWNMIKIMEYLPATTVQCLCLNHKLNSAVNTKILEKPSVSKMSRELLTTVQVVISLLKTWDKRPETRTRRSWVSSQMSKLGGIPLMTCWRGKSRSTPLSNLHWEDLLQICWVGAGG